MKLNSVLMGITSWFFLFIACHIEAQAELSLVINADIVTMNEKQANADAMAISHGRIIAIGTKEEVIAQIGTPENIQDLHGKTVVPGFIESHDHILLSSSVYALTDVSPFTTPTLREALDKIKNTKPDDQGWVMAFGADQELYQEGKGPNRKQLDKLFPNNPVIVFHLSGHGAFVNSKTFEKFAITAQTANPKGGYFEKDLENQLTGFVSGIPALLQIRDFPTPTVESAYLAASIRAKAGITTASELALMDKNNLEVLSEVTGDDNFPVRVVAGYVSSANDFADVVPLLKNYQNNLLKIPFIKTWTDGSIQGGTGSMSQGYYEPTMGSDGALGTQDFFNEQILTIYQQGFWPAIHANGDKAVDLALNAIEYAQNSLLEKSKNIRPQIIHAQYTRAEQIERMAALKVSPTFFVSHVYYWGDLHYRKSLGPKRAQRLSALGGAFNHGIKASMHNDPPVTPVNPLLNMWIAIKRQSVSGRVLGIEQALSAEQALAAYTINAAYQFGLEKDLGSLSVGKLADYVVLDRNPLKVKTDELRNIQVLKTVRAGEETFAR